MSKELPPNIQRFKTSLQAVGRSRHTVDAYVSDMRYFPDADDMTAEDIYDLLAQWQTEGITRRTIKRRLSALSSYYKYMVMVGKRMNNPALSINAQIPVDKSLPKALEAEQIQRIFATFKRPRDIAMFSLCLYAGLRVSELAAIDLDDINLDACRVMIRKGKGGKDRPAFFTEGAAAAIRAYLPYRHPTDPKALFTTTHGRMAVGSIKILFRRLAAKAGVTASIHALRHTFGTMMVDNDMDITFLQSLFGHASIQTTRIYVKTTESKARQAYEQASSKAFDGITTRQQAPAETDDVFAGI